MEGPAPSVPVEQLLAHRDWVRRVARALVRDENAADDLEQDAWMEALERPPRSPRSIGGWFTAAMRHNLIDRARAETSRKRREEDRARSEAVPSAADLVAKADAHRRVVVAVMDLAEPYRSTVLYRFFEDLGPGEVAARTGVPVETVRTRTRRALEILRSRLAAGQGEERRALAFGLAPLLGDGGPFAPGAGTATGASSGFAAALLGGVLMAKKGIAAAVALLVVLGVVAWLRPGVGEGGDRAIRPDGVASSASTDSAGAGGPSRGSTSEAAPAGTGAASVRSVPTRWLRVNVLDEAGAAVPGVTARCLFGTDGTLFPREVAGDAAGSLSIEAPADAPCRVVAKAAGFEDAESGVRPEHDPVLVVMRGKRSLGGRVVDGKSGKPLAGAIVVIQPGEEWGPGRKQWEAFSDERGEFRSDGLPPGRFMVGAGRCVAAVGPDWDYDDVRLGPVPADTKDLRIELTAGPVLAGVVQDDAGEPLRSPFIVSARTLVPGRTDTSYLMMYGAADAGRFRLRHVEPGLYDIVVVPQGVGPEFTPFAPAVLRRVPAGTEGLEVRLVRGLPIEGQAFDVDGKPVENVYVQAIGPTGAEPPPMSGGRPEGRFGTDLLDPRLEYDILVATSPMDPRGLMRFVKGVRPGTRDLKLVLKASEPISGVLLDPAGAPVGAAVPVTAQCLDLRYALFGRTVTNYTRDDGTFRIPLLGPAGDLRYRLCAGGGGSRFRPTIVEGPFPAGQSGIEIRLPSAGETVEGVVRLPPGAAPGRLPLRFTADLSTADGLGPPWYVEATADEKGRFRVENLPAGAVSIWAEFQDKHYLCGRLEAPSSGVDVLVPLK